MNPDETPYDTFYGNLFGVRKSVRYHQRRQAFHEWWNTVIIALSFACSASAMAEWSAEWRQVLIGATSFLLMLNWVIGLTRRANAHAKLGQRFVSLEQEMTPFERNRDIDAKDEFEFRRRRLEIEADEPAKMRVMDVLCHNELCEARYPDELVYPVSPWRRWLGHFIDVGEGSAPGQRTSASAGDRNMGNLSASTAV